MSQAVHEIQRFLYHQARQQPARPFDRLMRFVTDWTVLKAAWRQVCSRPGANTPGADRLGADDVTADPATARLFLQDLADALQAGTYRPGPVRRFAIAKPSQPGKTRPLAVLTLTDRVAHMALKLVLEPIVEARLGRRCFGFRPGRSRFDQLHAVRRVVHHHPDAFAAALTTDVAACFDQLDHRLLRDDLQAIVSDPAVLALGRRIFEQVGSGQAGWWRRRRIGVLQGSPLSPLLANWNLARFDRAWDRRTGDPAPAFRYADDLLILARDPHAAGRLRPALQRCLWRACRLELAADKTRITAFDQGVASLGLMVRRLRDPFDAAERVRIVLDPSRIREVLDEVHRWAEALDADRALGPQFARFNQRLRGWFEAYQFAHDAALAFETIDQHVFRASRARLKSLLGCSAAALQQRHYHRLSTGHHTWQADGVPLLVLGALPRRFYRPKPPRSPWDEPAPARGMAGPPTSHVPALDPAVLGIPDPPPPAGHHPRRDQGPGVPVDRGNGPIPDPSAASSDLSGISPLPAEAPGHDRPGRNGSPASGPEP
jgi:RNA-directed DNA polymerase